MHSLTFPYQQRQDHWLPLIPVTLFGPREPLQVEAYLDSGAKMSIIDYSVAEVLGLPLMHARIQQFIVGDGRYIHGRVVILPVQVDSVKFRAPIAFSKDLKVGFNLIGRQGFFEQFDEVAFQETRRQIILRYR